MTSILSLVEITQTPSLILGHQNKRSGPRVHLSVYFRSQSNKE